MKDEQFLIIAHAFSKAADKNPIGRVSLKNVRSSWTVFDNEGHPIWSKEDALRQRDGKTCRVGLGDASTKGTRPLFKNSMTQSFECRADFSSVCMEKVIQIRTAIANGSYGISSADLAQKLIDNMLEDLR